MKNLRKNKNCKPEYKTINDINRKITRGILETASSIMTERLNKINKLSVATKRLLDQRRVQKQIKQHEKWQDKI